MTDVVELSSRPERTRRGRSRLILAAVGVIVVVAGIPAGIWFAHWRSSLHPFLDYPSFGAGTPAVAGQTMYFGESVIPARVISHPKDVAPLSLQINSIWPVISENTAGAEIAVMRCNFRTGGPPPLGDDQATSRERCSTLMPFHNGPVKLGYGKGDDNLVIAVTPRHAGTVVISGVDVSYSSGLRHGSAHTGGRLTTTTK